MHPPCSSGRPRGAAGRGWPTILTLSFAAGLIQAGLIDQSLFNPDYRGIPYWADLREPTYLPGLGFSAYMLLGFVGGHMIQSFAAPIAIVESLSPDLGRRPWLRWPGLVIMALLYLAAAYFVLADQAKTEGFVASGPQLIGSAIVVVGAGDRGLRRAEAPIESHPATRRRRWWWASSRSTGLGDQGH